LKQILKNIFDAYILLNFHVASSVLAIYFIFNQNIDYYYSLFIFISTVLSYNLIRLLSFSGNRFFIKRFYCRFKQSIKIMLIYLTLITAYLFLRLDPQKQMSLIPLFIITFLYNFEFHKLPRLRDFGLIKIALVAFVWAGMTVIVPNINQLNEQIFLVALFVFFLIFLLTLGFDQRDVLIDQDDLGSIPQRFNNKLWLVYIVLTVILSVLNYYIMSTKFFLITEFFIILSSIMSYRSTIKKSFYYTAFWLESIPILWWLSIILIQ
jgi:hypothetical protein